MVMGDTQLTPFDMGTFGSRTTPVMNLQLRKVAAAALAALLEMTATQWQLSRDSLVAVDGKITHKESNRAVEYAALLKGRQFTQTVPAEEALTAPASWKAACQPMRKMDGRDFVTGKHRYPSDQKLPGMLHGKILRQDSFNATLVSADTLSGGFRRDGGVRRAFVAYPLPDTPATAARAAKLIKAEWQAKPQPSSAEFFDAMKKAAGQKDPSAEVSYQTGGSGKGAGKRRTSAAAILHRGIHRARAVGTSRRAGAMVRRQSHGVDGFSQRPFGVRTELAEAFRIPESRVRVILPDTGSGYGGKHTGEAAIEAARLARAAKRPVKVVWSRETIDLGPISGRRFDGSDQRRFAGRQNYRLRFPNYNSGEAGIRSYYNIPNQRSVFHEWMRHCARAHIAGWPRLRIILLVKCTWTSWRKRWAWTRWNFA